MPSTTLTPATLLDIYRDASLCRWRATSRGERRRVALPGLDGLLESAEHPSVVLLVTDDRACAELGEIVARAPAGMIVVLASAAGALELMRSRDGWTESPLAAMVRRGLSDVPARPLTERLTLRPVRRTDEDPDDWVALADAVACVIRAAPSEDPRQLSRFLRSLDALRLFAAVDARGTVRATAGYELIDGHARVLMIDTDPAWQRQGVGAAMTSAALRDAHRRGARDASLDASEQGDSVYRRLGFEPVGPTIRFTR